MLVDDLLKHLLTKEIKYASIGIIEGKTIFSAFSHPKWQEYYIRNSLHVDDPSFKTALLLPEVPVFWDSVPKYTNKSANIMKIRCEITGVYTGLTLSIKHLDKTLLLTLGTLLNERELPMMTAELLSNLKIKDILCYKIQ